MVWKGRGLATSKGVSGLQVLLLPASCPIHWWATFLKGELLFQEGQGGASHPAKLCRNSLYCNSVLSVLVTAQVPISSSARQRGL